MNEEGEGAIGVGKDGGSQAVKWLRLALGREIKERFPSQRQAAIAMGMSPQLLSAVMNCRGDRIRALERVAQKLERVDLLGMLYRGKVLDETGKDPESGLGENTADQSLDGLRARNIRLEGEVDAMNGRLEALERENAALRQELDSKREEIAQMAKNQLESMNRLIDTFIGKGKPEAGNAG